MESGVNMELVTVRGAITVENNTKEEILENTSLLLQEIIKKNNIKMKNVISIIFTATEDLNKVYPAVAARELGFTKCGLMCFQEMKVENSLTKCIRVMLFIKSNMSQAEVKHIYLRDAKKLRPDLS